MTNIAENATDAALAAILNKGLEIATQTGEWVAEQVPLLVQQFLMWNLFTSLVGMTIGGAILYLLRVIKQHPEFGVDREWGGDRIFRYISIAGVSLVGTPVFLCNLMAAVKIAMFPELYLLQTAIDLMRP